MKNIRNAVLTLVAIVTGVILFFNDASQARFVRGVLPGASGGPTGRVVQNGFSNGSSATQGSSYVWKNFFKGSGASGSVSPNGNNLATALNANQFPDGLLSANLGQSLFLPPDIYLGPVRFKWTGTMSGTGLFVGLNMTATSGGSFLSGNSFSGTDGDVTFNINATATSTTSNSIALGNQTFTIGTGLSISPGDKMTVAQTGSLTNYMIGNVVSYSGSTLVININSIYGSGTFTSWNIWAAPETTNTFFWGGTTFSNMSSIILCRDQDFATINSDPFYHQFLYVLQTLNPLIIRPMGESLSGGNEQQSNPLWDLRKPVTAMSYSNDKTYPPTAYAGNSSGVDALSTGSYPSMPVSWTDKEAFTFFIPLNTVTITIASPARLTLPKSVVPGEAIALYTTGALPTGLTASRFQTSQSVFSAISCGCITYYYALDAGTSNIRIAATPGGSAINTSGTQSGTHSMAPTTARVINAVADNGSNIPRLTLDSTTGLATNDIVQVNMGNMGAFRITVINSTQIDLSTSYPSGAVLNYSAGGQTWSATTGNSPIIDPGSGGTGRSYLTVSSIDVGSRGPKPLTGTYGVPMPPGNLTMASVFGGVNICVYDADIDIAMCGPGGLYTMGMPIEMQVTLANKLNKHLWYSFPADVSMATVSSSCQYIAQNLNSNLKLYSAYGNENWNLVFAQYYYQVRFGVANNYAYNNSGPVQQAYTTTGFKTLQLNQACKTAWTGAGRSASSLVRLIQHQAASDLALTRDFLYNGNDLPAPNNAFPNRPVDFADAGSFANYWHGVLLNSGYSGSGSEYAELTTAASNYASGNPSLMAAALAWVYGDYMGTNGTAVPTGSSNFSVFSQTHTGGTNLGIAPRWEGLFASYDSQRASVGLAPLDGVLYEGGQDARPPNTGECANLGISASCADISTLLTAFKFDALGAQMVFDGQSAFVSATFPHTKNGAFLQLEGPNEWSLLSGDFFSRPYQFYNGAVQYNQ